MKLFLIFLKVIFQVCLVLVLLFTGLMLLTSRTDKLSGIKSMVVLTGSMAPTIPPGSIIFTVPAEWYFRGDVITFKNKSGVFVTHRLVRKVIDEQGTFYKVKGDANQTADSELVPPAAVTGKAVWFIPYLGRVVQFLQTFPGFLGLVVMPALLLIGFELWQIKNEIVKETEKRMLSRISSVS